MTGAPGLPPSLVRQEAGELPQLPDGFQLGGTGGRLPLTGLPHSLPKPALMRTSWSRVVAEEEEREEEEEEEVASPSQQAAERGSRRGGVWDRPCSPGSLPPTRRLRVR